MISLDTNLILSALNPNDVNYTRALNALDTHAQQALCICPVVYAELRASGAWSAIHAWLNLQGVSVVWEMPASVWESAGVAFGQYAVLRRAGSVPRRLVADFLIAAHAQHHRLEVLSFDATPLGQESCRVD
jgi:predicted nucleic acid-binding protein